jgi:hypothetical protein
VSLCVFRAPLNGEDSPDEESDDEANDVSTNEDLGTDTNFQV